MYASQSMNMNWICLFWSWSNIIVTFNHTCIWRKWSFSGVEVRYNFLYLGRPGFITRGNDRVEGGRSNGGIPSLNKQYRWIVRFLIFLAYIKTWLKEPNIYVLICYPENCQLLHKIHLSQHGLLPDKSLNPPPLKKLHYLDDECKHGKRLNDKKFITAK